VAGTLGAQPVPTPPKPALATAEPPAKVRLLSWKMAYLYDEDFSELQFHDIQFPGPTCAFALGSQITKGKGKPVSLRSLDGGKTWSLLPLKTHGRSAFFLSERLGWMVTEDGLERSGDCGATWEKVGKEKGLVRAWFRDEALGWAVGGPKKALATRDGGRTWAPLKPVDNPKSDENRSVYAWVEFSNEKFGAIVGWHSPQRRSAQFPVWMDPESAQYRRQWPSLTLMLQTLDGGMAWKGFTASLLGRMTRVRMAPNGAGLALIEFDEGFDYPSEVYLMGVGKAEIRRLYRDKQHAVTDLVVMRDGWMYLAGVQTTGTVRLPLPGKVRILRSLDGSLWTEDPADYRATANRVHLAVSPAGRMLAATDTGMILRLE
jgi:hypothetical protein